MILDSVRHSLRAVTVAGMLLGAPNGASADVILGAVSAAINSGGPGFGSIDDTFNQFGLSAAYDSGVTDFDAYLASNPTHTIAFDGFDWFSDEFATDASVTYDLGAVHSINRIALWNEETSGIGLLDLYGSTDGVVFSPLALDLVPTDNPFTDTFDPYPADVFAFAAASVRYIRFEMSECPQPDPGGFEACAIGEVAFAKGDSVPEPASAGLIGLGLAAAAAVRRRRARR